ncbi:MAG: hypothetical protein A2X35_12630 [Elusimicrobia bacterium GWA2_61_42]|nr:MAG: hypothetical protein A2X35_12630 [Elusimicrobia bacterium GWA2_61_42]OGR75340.1 MAG: hypothetical protein A2X38_06075 [Elusimicrobia bacterium GWC2_61_25]
MMTEKNNGSAAKAGTRFPALYFFAALAASAVSLFLFYSHARSVYADTAKLHSSHYELLDGVRNIIEYDSRLTMAAGLAASTGEAAYTREYDGLAAELDAAIKKLNTFTVAKEGSPYTAKINEANLRLEEIERRAISLSRAGKRREASALLAGTEYLRLKKAYAAGVKGLMSEFESSHLDESAVSRDIIVKKSLAAAASASISLLLWALAAFSIRRWLKVRGSAESLVAEKEAEFRHFFDTVQEIFYRADWKGRLTDITPSIKKYAGYTREELLGRPISNLYLNPEDRNPLIKALLTKGIVEDYEVKLKTKDRGVLDVLVNARLLRGFGGLPAGIEGSLRDITRRKASEDRLRRMNRLYTILSRVNEAIVRVRTPQKLYEEICRIAVENGGIKFAWVGMPLTEGLIFPVASSGEDEGYLRDLKISTDPGAPESRGPSGTAARENRVVINSDTETNPDMLPWRYEALRRGFRSSAVFPIGGGGIINFYAEESGFFMEEEERLLASLSEDITHAVNSMKSELAQAETASQLEYTREQLRQSQKMEAIGRLAGGVAHDFNNILTAILSYAGFLNSSLEPADPRRSDVGEITAAAERAAALTRQLLAFSRRQVLLPRVIDLNGVIRGMEVMLRRLIGEHIELSLRLSENPAMIKADPGQLEQAILNLAVNSRDAISGSGRIILETAEVILTEDAPGRHDIVPPGRYVRLIISDTGGGMGADTQTHIFEPFFTTKEPGKGTGLGLSMVYGTIKQSGGYIWVYSEPGSGTSFKIYFPETREAAEAAVEPLPAGKSAGGTETLLLVEDEAQVRAALSRALRENGYTVLEAANGADALELGPETFKKARLLITDLVMPKMGGIEMAASVRAAVPGLPVIYISGYSEELISARENLGENSLFVQKPVDPETLLAKVREALALGAKK